MCRLALLVALSTALLGPSQGSGAQPLAWSPGAERLLAADGAARAPEDLKRQLVRNRAAYMRGVTEAGRRDPGSRAPEALRASASRHARAAVEAIRTLRGFPAAVQSLGAAAHDLALLHPPSRQAGESLEAPSRASFLGYPEGPLPGLDQLLAGPGPARPGDRSYDRAVTVLTHLMAWVWQEAGGDVSSTRNLPRSKGPYIVREK